MHKTKCERNNAETVYSQEEVNQILSKRLTRANGRFEREFQHKMLQIEVQGRLKKENIPTSFAKFIFVSKNENRVRANLESFIKTWCENTKK